MAPSRYKTLFLLGFCLALITGVGVAALQSGDPASDGVAVGSPSNTNVTLEGSTDLDYESLFPDADTVELNTTSGNITFSSSGSVDATIDESNITGTYTKVSGITAGANQLTINPEDKDQITVGKQIDRIEWRDNIALDDGTADFIYAGTSGQSEVKIYELPADTDVVAVDANTDNLLDTGTTDGNGVVTFSGLDNSAHTVKLQEEDNPDAPQLDDDSMSPTGTVRTENVMLSIDVDDPQYPSETVTLEWYVDGNLENTTTANSAGTHTAKVGPFADGTHDWYVDATDSNGNTATSTTKNFEISHFRPNVTSISPTGKLQQEPSTLEVGITDKDFASGFDGDNISVQVDVDGNTQIDTNIQSNSTLTSSLPSSALTGGQHDITVYADDTYGNNVTAFDTYSIPANLTIRNELNYSELIAADGEIRFVGSDEVYNRSASNGVLEMDNLPVNQDFIVEIYPTNSDFENRTIYIESIYEQQSAYTINTNTSAGGVESITSRFVLNDPTAEYDSNSVLKIKRPINISGKTTFETIAADRFGAEGYIVTLQNDTRYRLAVTNTQNEQTVGPYRAVVSETVEVQPGQPTVELTFEDTNWAANAVLNNDTLEYRYNDPTQETDILTVWIHERNNPQNQLTANATYSDVGDVSAKVSLTANQTNKEWVVVFVTERNGETIITSVNTANQADLLPADLDAGWVRIMGVGILVLFAGAFSMLNAGIGAVIVSLVGGLLWFIGLLGGATSAAAVTVALFISVLGHLYGRT